MAIRKKRSEDQELADVLHNHEQRLARLEQMSEQGLLDTDSDNGEKSTSLIVVPSWDEIYRNATAMTGSGHKLPELLTDEELENCNDQLKGLHRAYNQIHHLDKADVAISAAGGLVAALIDIFLVGIPEKTTEGLKEGPLGNHVRSWFKKRFDSEELAKLAQAKVTYDAPYNAGFTTTNVEGLNTFMHRLYSLGHDPIIGLIIGVLDVMSGKMTTIDAAGNLVSQVMESHDYRGRIEVQAFDALAKVVLHFKSDVNTAMGLPAPLMGLFNLCQFGNITDENLTIAEVVQGMYYGGFDFVHFCSQSISVMAAEVLVRVLYALKRVNEGHEIKDSIPLSLDHEKNPKLATMLFMAHTSATAINAGKVYFAYKSVAVTHQDPFVSINYPQWIAFAVYSFKQAKWVLFDKPDRQHTYTMDCLYEELDLILEDTEAGFENEAAGRKIVFFLASALTTSCCHIY